MTIEKQWISITGRVTACATHDLNNVLATIRESAGLIKDCQASGSFSDDRWAAAMKNSVNIIESQLAQGSRVVDAVNRFAHMADADRPEKGDLQDIAAYAVSLMSGPAGRNGVSLETAFPAEPKQAPVKGDFFLLNAAVFFALDIAVAMTGREGGSSVSVSVEEAGDDFLLTVSGSWGSAALPENSPEWPSVQQSMASVSGQVKKDDAANEIHLYFLRYISI